MTDKEAFSGIRVLDFSQGIAGPHSAMLLAQHGADVIKAEPITGDWGRTLGRSYGQNAAHSIAFNRGKRSIALDLTKPRGLEVAPPDEARRRRHRGISARRDGKIQAWLRGRQGRQP